MGKYQEGIDGYYLTFSIMKVLPLWNHSINVLCIKSFKMDMKVLLKDAVGKVVLLRGLKMIEAIFEKEYSDG